MNVRKLFFAAVVCALSLCATAQVKRPRLVVGMVVDQMRWDYLYYYYDRFGEGGLRRLVDQGFSCENTYINYVPTVTAIGHASIYTGSTPALHGICGNDFYLDGSKAYCCEDATVNGVGTNEKAGKCSPRLMLATTIGDELRLATDFRSRVFGVCIKDRGAILPAGHTANAAYWWSEKDGHFISSTYYMDKLPAWVERFNKDNHTAPDHKLLEDVEGVSFTFRMAEAVIDNEQLGQRGETDMLCVSVSCTDAIGHRDGIHAETLEEIYMRLDRDLARFFNKLDQLYGKDGYLFFLSADHGSAYSPKILNEHKVNAGYWSFSDACKRLKQHLEKKFDVDGLTIMDNSYSICFNREEIAEKGLDFDEVRAEAVRFFKQDKELLYVVDLHHVVDATLPEHLKQQICNGWHSRRAGDIMCITRPNIFPWKYGEDYRGTTHGAWNSYDAHIPLVFLGWNVSHGSTAATTHITDIAPTVCSLLHIPAPNSSIGNAITSVTDAK